MVNFHTKKANLGLWDGKNLVYFVAIRFCIAILVYFVGIRYFCGHFGIILPVLVCCTKKNLATLSGWQNSPLLADISQAQNKSFFEVCARFALAPLRESKAPSWIFAVRVTFECLAFEAFISYAQGSML
jgi:hypothetical protein